MKEKKIILIFSHILDSHQKTYLKDNYNITNYIYLPNNLQDIWSNIDPDIESLNECIEPIFEYITNNLQKDDLALVQGDFGATYTMVNFLKKLEILPLYATTKRVTKEYLNKENKLEKKSIFEFRRFREYE